MYNPDFFVIIYKIFINVLQLFYLTFLKKGDIIIKLSDGEHQENVSGLRKISLQKFF